MKSLENGKVKLAVGVLTSIKHLGIQPITMPKRYLKTILITKSLCTCR